MNKNTVNLLSKAKQSKAKQSHNCLLNNNFKFYISQFLNASILLCKTRGFNPLLLFAFAHNGLKPHCYKKWIATPHAVCLTASARNDNFNYPYVLKNNFAILNLVKTFLTSIKFTFDNLSRKIKSPCLVINKNSFLRRKLSCIISKNFLPTWS